MEVARDLYELKKLISELELVDNKRDYHRYRVEIAGNYFVEQKNHRGTLSPCRLVDVSTKGACIEIEEAAVQVGDIVHLQFAIGSSIADAVGKVAYINRKGDVYKVGLQSGSEKDNILHQLFN